jgi:hypothetical protein
VKRDGKVEYQWHQVYVPVRIVDEVLSLIDERKAVEDVLIAIEKGNKAR